MEAQCCPHRPRGCLLPSRSRQAALGGEIRNLDWKAFRIDASKDGRGEQPVLNCSGVEQFMGPGRKSSHVSRPGPHTMTYEPKVRA